MIRSQSIILLGKLSKLIQGAFSGITPASIIMKVQDLFMNLLSKIMKKDPINI
jgi:hypothetical protein